MINKIKSYLKTKQVLGVMADLLFKKG